MTLLYESQDIGLATGVLGSIRAIGGAVAQTIYVSILNNKLATYLPRYIAPVAASAGLPPASASSLIAAISAGSTDLASAVPGGAEVLTPDVLVAVGEATKRAYISSFRVVFFATIPFGVLLIFFSVLSPNFEKYLSLNVAKRLQGMGRVEVVEEGRESEGGAV